MSRPHVQRPVFGVHWADGVAFLLQKAGAANAMGIDIPVPFPINGRASCPHHIVVPARSLTHSQIDDPLFRVMSPLPGRGVYLSACHPAITTELEALCSPQERLSFPIWYLTLGQVRQRLDHTNVAPLVLTDVKVSDLPAVRQIMALAGASERRVLFLRSEWLPKLPDVTVIETGISTVDAPETLSAVGAAMLTRYMLGQDPPT